MGILKGEPISGPDFSEILWEDEGFCAELGRVMLAANRLESALGQFVDERAPEAKKAKAKATLGMLIGVAEKYGLLTSMLPALRTLQIQRNYLAHNIHALLTDLIEETILERTELLDSDVATYTERAWVLRRNLVDLAEIIEIET